MTLGLWEAARRAGSGLDVRLALDVDCDAVAVYRHNFPSAAARVDDVGALFGGQHGSGLTSQESAVRASAGEVDVLLGGPPCQGHSDLNNHSRRKDPRNELYLKMARAAEVLRPKIVVIENVIAVQHDQTSVVSQTIRELGASGYRVAGRVLDLNRVGVPQRRRRFLLVASRLEAVDPTGLLASVSETMPGHPDRTVRWAIHDLLDHPGATVYDTPSRATRVNAERMGVLFEQDLYDLPDKYRPECHAGGGHSYVSVYGRLRWDRPAQTITTGFGCMGQGRYVHPARRRTITPHEAARLQTFPDWFDFGENARRTFLAKVIGNAVPPMLMLRLGELIVPHLVSRSNGRRHR